TRHNVQLSTISSLYRHLGHRNVHLFAHHDMQDVITYDDNGKNRAGGIVTRNLITGELKAYTGHAVILGTGGYGNVYHTSTLAKNSNAGALMRAYEQGAFFASPAFIQFHPTGLP